MLNYEFHSGYLRHAWRNKAKIAMFWPGFLARGVDVIVGMFAANSSRR
jgi:hypothetical protein